MMQQVKLRPGWSPRLLVSGLCYSPAAAQLFSVTHTGISLKIFFGMGIGTQGTPVL